MEQQIERKVRDIIQTEQKEMEQQTGGFSYEVSEYDMKEYIQSVIQERDSSSILVKQKTIETVQDPSHITDSRLSTSSAAKPTAAEKEEKTHNTTIEDLVKSLSSAGATVQVSALNTLVSSSKASEGMKEEVLKVNGENVQAFEHKDDDAAFDDILTKRTTLDESSEYKNDMTTNRSHTYKAANLVAQYLGDNLEIINLLENILGKEISVAAMPSNKDMETEAARLAKEMKETERRERELT